MGALWMLVAGFLFGCMGVFVKLGAAYFSNIELVFYAPSSASSSSYRLRASARQHRHQTFSSHLWRGLSGTIALLLFFYCITVLPLATQ